MKTFIPSNKLQLEQIIQSWSSKISVERAVTLPSAFYTSRDVFELEKHAVFGQNWLLTGRTSQLTKPGDYLTDQIFSEPFIVAVDTASNLRGYYNVCCHHGMRLLENNQGHLDKNEIVCPYHGWIYDLNGRLRKAVRMKTIEQFQASKVRLKNISVQAIGPLIYYNFNRTNTNENTSHIEHIHNKYLLATNYDQLEFVTRKTYHLKCNWKVFVDNYLDGGYHIPYAHKQLNSILNMDQYKIVVDHPKISVQYCSGTQRTEGAVVFAFVYPNLMINRYGSLMDTNLVVPIDERNCLVHMDYYYDPKTTNKADEEILRKDSHAVQNEDIYLCENVQIGLESQAYDSGRYVPTVEFPMFDFHKTLHEQLENFYQTNMK